MHVADSGHHDSTDLSEVVDTVVGLMGPPLQAHSRPPRPPLPPNRKKAGIPDGLNHLGALPPLPSNGKKAYTDKAESSMIGKSLILIKSILLFYSAKKIS